MTITLPAASANYIGVRFIIRRTGGTATTTVNSASSNIIPANSVTAAATILASNAYTAEIYCTYITSTTFGLYLR